MKRILIIIALVAAATVTNAQDIESGIVKIFVTSSRVYVSVPWQKYPPQESTGTGFVIDGHRIMTAAHVIAFSTFVQVKRAGESKKYTANVEFVSHQADLAILTVEDPSFFSNAAALAFDDLPNIQDRVSIIGYPTGGQEISYSTGIVSRIETQEYAQSKEQFLAIQIDAPVNPGNSGGPAMIGNKVVGIAMQTISSGQNLNYLIPVCVIEHFLVDIKDGRVDGFPSLLANFEFMDNRMLRSFYGLKPDGDQGVLVYAVNYEDNAKQALQIEDIVLEINGNKVYANGKYELKPKMLVSCWHIVNMAQAGDEITYRVIRKGKEITVREKATLRTPLVPYVSHDTKPPYFIYCGFVFIKHNRDFYSAYGSDAPPVGIQMHDAEPRKANYRETVLLMSVLAHDVNAGYFAGNFVQSVNESPVESLADMIAKIDAADKWVKIKFDDGSFIVIDKALAPGVNADVLKTYQIPAASSMDR
jgi:S1-C subfamily serine protease